MSDQEDFEKLLANMTSARQALTRAEEDLFVAQQRHRAAASALETELIVLLHERLGGVLVTNDGQLSPAAHPDPAAFLEDVRGKGAGRR